MQLAIGVDLGGTKIEAVALDGQGHERFRRRRPTPRGSYEGTLDAIRDLVLEAEQALGARGTVGVGHPGAVSPATRATASTMPVAIPGSAAGKTTRNTV